MTDTPQNLHEQASEGSIAALEELTSLAEEGDVIAMVLLAELHDETGPICIQQNLTFARHWYEMAAERGNSLAQMCFANMCHYGQGGSSDLVLAFKWYLASAEQGDGEAQMHVGRFYETGMVGDVNVGEAIKWYKKAVENGHELAATNLAIITYNTAQDEDAYKKAFDLFSFAAEKGDGLAHLMLGEMNLRGHGTEAHGGRSLLHHFIAEALLPDGDNRRAATKRKEFILAQHPDAREEFSVRTKEYLEDKGFERPQ